MRLSGVAWYFVQSVVLGLWMWNFISLAPGSITQLYGPEWGWVAFVDFWFVFLGVLAAATVTQALSYGIDWLRYRLLPWLRKGFMAL